MEKSNVFCVFSPVGQLSLQDKARTLSHHDVATFLASIKLDQYVEKFKDFEISGDVLLEMTPSDLAELGVKSALDKLRILVGFRRYLETGEVKFSSSKLVVALTTSNLGQYRKLIEQNNVDGDMLLYEDEKLVRAMLQEIGVESGLNITRIISKFKTYASIR